MRIFVPILNCFASAFGCGNCKLKLYSQHIFIIELLFKNIYKIFKFNKVSKNLRKKWKLIKLWITRDGPWKWERNERQKMVFSVLYKVSAKWWFPGRFEIWKFQHRDYNSRQDSQLYFPDQKTNRFYDNNDLYLNWKRTNQSQSKAPQARTCWHDVNLSTTIPSFSFFSSRVL